MNTNIKSFRKLSKKQKKPSKQIEKEWIYLDEMEDFGEIIILFVTKLINQELSLGEELIHGGNCDGVKVASSCS